MPNTTHRVAEFVGTRQSAEGSPSICKVDTVSSIPTTRSASNRARSSSMSLCKPVRLKRAVRRWFITSLCGVSSSQSKRYQTRVAFRTPSTEGAKLTGHESTSPWSRARHRAADPRCSEALLPSVQGRCERHPMFITRLDRDDYRIEHVEGTIFKPITARDMTAGEKRNYRRLRR